MARRHMLMIAVALVTFLVLLLALTAGAVAGPKVLVVGPGETYVVTDVMNLNKLALGTGAVLTGDADHSLTLTRNGVEMGIEAGKTYTGNLVLTPTEHLTFAGAGGPPGPPGPPAYFRTAIYVQDGVYVPEKSVPSAVLGTKKVTDSYAKNILINSIGPLFNGIIVDGDSTYSIDNAKINFTGPGGNDFSGYGFGIMATGEANVTVNKAKIVTDGVIRGAVSCSGRSATLWNHDVDRVTQG